MGRRRGPCARRWTEHKTEKGVTYYYNSITKVSTYDKPEGFGAAAAQKYVPALSRSHAHARPIPYLVPRPQPPALSRSPVSFPCLGLWSASKSNVCVRA